jgi:hypothetical protein
MPAIVPSYIAKLARAEKHLMELDAAITAWANTHPYRVVKRLERTGKRPTFRITFTAEPANTDIPVIAADAIYNLRSALDHLMSCLVPNSQRSSVIFPIFFQGVWSAPTPGENDQRIKERARWASDTKAVERGALAILKQLQPPDGTLDPTEENLLQLLNAFSNRDRHERLPVIAAGIRDIRVMFNRPDGSSHRARGVIDSAGMLENNASISAIPKDALNVLIRGEPRVAINVGGGRGRVRRDGLLPDHLQDAKRFIEQSLIAPLSHFVRR